MYEHWEKEAGDNKKGLNYTRVFFFFLHFLLDY